jgi:hypothetical protein
MSQRLCIGATDETFYDCIIEEKDDKESIKNKLLSEWLQVSEHIFFGPWKIKIIDLCLFRKIQPIIEDVFLEMGLQYPKDIWVIYYKNLAISPNFTKKELEYFLDAVED